MSYQNSRCSCFYDPMDFPSLLQNSHILLNYLEELPYSSFFFFFLALQETSQYLQLFTSDFNLPESTIRNPHYECLVTISTCSCALTFNEDKQGSKHEQDAELHLVYASACYVFHSDGYSTVTVTVYIHSATWYLVIMCCTWCQLWEISEKNNIYIFVCVCVCVCVFWFHFGASTCAAEGSHGTVGSGTDQRPRWG